MNPAESIRLGFTRSSTILKLLSFAQQLKKPQLQNMTYGVLRLVFLHTCFYLLILLSKLHTPWCWLRGSTFTASFPCRSLWHSSVALCSPLCSAERGKAFSPERHHPEELPKPLGTHTPSPFKHLGCSRHSWRSQARAGRGIPSRLSCRMSE